MELPAGLGDDTLKDFLSGVMLEGLVDSFPSLPPAPSFDESLANPAVMKRIALDVITNLAPIFHNAAMEFPHPDSDPKVGKMQEWLEGLTVEQLKFIVDLSVWMQMGMI